MKLVSIITPAYNSRETIEQTRESVLAQNFSDWEWIIVDDCLCLTVTIPRNSEQRKSQTETIPKKWPKIKRSCSRRTRLLY